MVDSHRTARHPPDRAFHSVHVRPDTAIWSLARRDCPPIEIDGDWYWDGGIVSNTPLDVIIDQLPRRSTLCFMVDLFDAAGPMPRTIEDVEARHKDIMYASRSGRSIEAHRAKHDLRRAVMALWQALPPERQKDPHLHDLAELG